MRKYKIGEVAKILGTTTQALRFYEQEDVIAPPKSENGTRYFTEPDIIRLMAFKRFCLSEFTVQDVARHFSQGNLGTLTDRLAEKSAMLEKEGELLLRRARAIRHFEATLREAQSQMDEIRCVDRPQIFMHECTLAQLDQLSDAQRESFLAFMDAMPDTHICYVYNANDTARSQSDFRFAVTKTEAEAWNLPLDHALVFEPCRCARIYVRTDARLWDNTYLQSFVARVQEAGYEVDPALPLIGQQLSSEHTGKIGLLIAAIYIPVKKETENE